MNNKKLKDLIEQLKEVSEELRSAETLGAEEKEEEKKAAIEAAEVCAEVAEVSSNPQETEKVNVAEKAAQTDENISTFAVYSPTEEMHCYKDFELPDNITVKTDLLKKNTAVVIDILRGSKTISGLKPVLVYNTRNAFMGLGKWFKFNIHDTYLNETYTDSLGDSYKLDGDGFVAGMKYTATAPAFVDSILREIGRTEIANFTVWLSNGNIAKGFARYGNMRFICDASGKYMEMEYSGDTRITTIKEGDSKNQDKLKHYNFEYDKYMHLTKITNYYFEYDEKNQMYNEREGKRITFECSSNNLNKVSYSDGRSLSFSYDRNNMTITSSEGYIHKITSSETEVNVTTQSTLSKIPSGANVSNPAMLSYKITFGDTVKIEDKDGNNEYYKFKDNGEKIMLSEYYRENYSVVTYAEKRTYTFNSNNNKYILKTFFAPKSLLYDKPYSSFVYNERYDDEYTECTYDEYNRPQYENRKNHLVDADGTYDSFINYYKTNTYNDNGLLTKESTDYRLYSILLNEGETEEGGSCTQVTEYEYYTDNRLKKRTSYYTDRVTTKGKDIEEYVYTKSGSTTKTTVLKYNSLDASKAFVNETVDDGYGNVLSQTDATGLKKMKYAWDDNDNLQSVTMPDDNLIEYEHDAEGRLLKVKSIPDYRDENNLSYEKGELTKCSSKQNDFMFEYDGKRRLSKATNGYMEIYSITYSADNANPVKLVVKNAKSENFICEEDKEHTYTKISYGINTELNTVYEARHLISSKSDALTGETAKYAYDKTEKLSSYEVKENNITTYTAQFTYNPEGRIQRINQGGRTGISYEYEYGEICDGRLLGMKAGEERFYLNYDLLGRNTGRRVYYGQTRKNVLTETISYKQVNTLVPTSSGTKSMYKQSILPSKISYSGGEYLDYTYDDNGNITGISKNGSNKIVYQYDGLGRLIYEHNPLLNKTYYYEYDNNGNIVSKEVVSNGVSEYTIYTCSKDRLINDGEGHRIFYDTLGNPTSYRGKDLTWEKGKRLKKYGETTFEYDGRGRRTKKNTVRYYYDYADKLIASSDGMEYFYDHIGVAGFKKDGAWYVYKRDIQNNVTGILDSNGTEVVKYEYDAWGNHSVSGSKAGTLGAINPFRYRSYFYDTETKLYYLKSRYYDPYVCRFLNMDSVDYAEPGVINGLNLYTYCGNNPVMNVDPDGNSFIVIALIVGGLLVGSVVNGIIAGANAAEGESFGSAFLGGFVNGLISGVGLAAGLALAASGGLPLLIAGGAVAAGLGFVGGFVGNVITQSISYGDVDWNVAKIAGGISAGANLLLFSGLRVSGAYSVAGSFLKGFAENLYLDMIPLAMSVYLGTLPIFNPNELRGKL